MNKIYAIANQKGGVGKTTLTLNLGANLAQNGAKVLLIDCDSQANLTTALGVEQPDELPCAMPELFSELIKNKPKNSEILSNKSYILHGKNLDFIPLNIKLAEIENALANAMSRENTLKKLIKFLKDDYDYILIDTMPSLNVITVNALTAADEVIIPVQSQFFSAKGLELLYETVYKIRENLNPNLKIAGALFTMFDGRVNFHKEVLQIVEETYGEYFKVFQSKIPTSVRVTESQSRCESIFDYEPNGKIAEAYTNFTQEILNLC